MSFQAVRRYYEQPVEAAAATAGVPFRYENQLKASGDADDEFITTRLNYGVMTEPTTCGSIEAIRAVLIVEYYGPKGVGPGRAQTVMAEISQALNALSYRPKARVEGVLGTVLRMNGPEFAALDDRPYFFARLTAPLLASYKSP